MKITMESTDQLTEIDGVPVCVWEGVTGRGVPCKVFVHRVGVTVEADAAELERDLEEQLQPGRAVPLRSVL